MKGSVIKQLNRSAIILAALAANPAFADFHLDGDLTITYPTGQTKSLKMPISYSSTNDDHTFVVGQQKYHVGGQPEKYSIAVVLQKNNFVWVQEFTQGYFEEFEWVIGEHKLKLYKEILAKPVKGDYVLSIDDNDYFFQNRLTQIELLFNEEGIEAIEASGFVASLGLNKAKTDKNETCGDEAASEESSEENCSAKE